MATALGPIASYRYDAFNRRIERTLGAETEQTVWSGWQSLETYRNGTLASRRTYGLGLDEIVKLEQDEDGDGELDPTRVPLYDTSGNLVALTRGTDGVPIEKYAYSPFGEQRIYVDLTRPRIEQLRREGETLLLEVSERIQFLALLRAQTAGELTLTDTSTGQAIEVELNLPVPSGPSARKRISIRPTAPVVEGAPLHLHLAPTAILDAFLNGLAAAYDRDLAWSATGTSLIEDTAPPELALVRVYENVLTVAFTEAIDPTQAATAITVDGNPVTWVADEGGYSVHTDPPLASGQHRIEIAASLTDLVGTPLGTGFSHTVEFTPLGALVYARPDPREITSSAASNPYGFQGLPKDPETGFVYMRNRYYDPELGRFVTPDPLGYVDGGNLYQYAGNDPVNGADPFGLCLGLNNEPCSVTADRASTWLHEKAVQVGANGYGATSVLWDWAIGSATDAVDMLLLDPLRAGKATGSAIGSGAGGSAIALSAAQDLGRVAAVAAGAGTAVRSAAQGATSLSRVGGTALRTERELAQAVRTSASTAAPALATGEASTALVPTATKSLGRWRESRLVQVLEGAGSKPPRPFDTSMGKRYVDRLVDGVAHEAKAGVNVRLTSSIRKQIAKDAELVQLGEIEGAHWHFFQGASPEVLAELQANRIPYTLHPRP